MPEMFDFGGYATKNDLKCADGRTIRRDAFKDCDGMTVPLVWGHKHDDPSKVLGHVLLENRDDGVFAYGVFNDTEAGKNAKELVKHGDVKALSIYANGLKEKAGNVLHGMIREVSLCLAGANPGARIEDLSFGHDIDDDEDFEALIYNGYNIQLPPPIMHSAMPAMPMRPPMPPMPPAPIMPPPMAMRPPMPPMRPMPPMQPMPAPAPIMHAAVPAGNKQNGGNNMANNEPTVQDVFNTLNEDQKNVVYYIIGTILNRSGVTNQEDDNMSHNLFEANENGVLMHDALNTVIADAKKFGSLKDSYEFHMQEGGALAHAIDTTGMDVPSMSNADYATNVGYGINGVDYLFPDARMIDNQPIFIKRDTDWVDVVLQGTHKSAFARIKSIFANITELEARAKGYLKGNEKKEEFFSLMKRVTVPQTVYKKQKMDRDDIIDITDFNVVAMIKTEMRSMLNEELARAILIGDGRLGSDDDKISEDHIRPIVSDKPLFTIQAAVNAGTTDEATAKNMMKAALKARKDYKGSGNPTLFTTEEWLTNMLLIEDGIGHYMYKSEAELATALRVNKIVTVPVMEGFQDADDHDVLGIIVNLKDYNIGADKGGEINMFDDFNIDYNQYIYLIETRCSGALIKPYSAIVLYKAAAGA